MATLRRSSEERMSSKLDGFSVSSSAAIETPDGTSTPGSPMEAKTRSVVDYLNEHFPTMESLDGLEAQLAEMRTRLRALDAELAQTVRHQLQVRRQGAHDLEHACRQIKKLENELLDTEQAMRGAAQLLHDFANQLRPVAEARHNLLQARAHLQAVVRLARALRDMEGHDAAKDLVRIAALVRQAKEALAVLQELPSLPLLEQFRQRYRVLEQRFGAAAAALFTETAEVPDKVNYQAGCSLADALDNGTREAIVSAFLLRRVRRYEEVFGAADSDLTPIETFERSFAWIRRELRAFDERWSDVFPNSWCMPMALSASLVDALRRIAHRDLEEGKVDVAQLLRALQITIEFEAELSRRLHAPLTWSLSSVFEPYMGAYVALENHRLRESIDKALEAESWLVAELRERLLPPEQPDETLVLPSAKALFIEIKRCMKRCGVLTTSQTYFNLHKAFKKHLRYYASAMERELLRIRSSTVTDLARTGPSMTEQQDITISKVCSLILTAEYCARTTDQLAETIRRAVDQAFMDSIRMAEERDEFRAIAGRAGKVLVTLTSAWVLDPALNALQTQRWSVYPAVGDVSPAISTLVESLLQLAKRISCQLPTLFFRFYLDKLSGTILESFQNTLFRCKPLNDAAAQQLLLDAQFLREQVLKLASCSGRETEPFDPWWSGFQRHVQSECSRIEAMLKVRLANNENIADAFEALVPDAEPAALRQILEWKGLTPLEAARQVVQYAERIEDATMLLKARAEMEEFVSDPERTTTDGNGVGHRSSRLERVESLTSSSILEKAPTEQRDGSARPHLDVSGTTSADVRSFLNRLGERIREARLGDKLESTIEAVSRQRSRRSGS